MKLQGGKTEAEIATRAIGVLQDIALVRAAVLHEEHVKVDLLTALTAAWNRLPA